MATAIWKVALEGDREDLLALSRCFTEPECRVEEAWGRFHLTSSRFDAEPASFGRPLAQAKGSLDMPSRLAADEVRATAEEMLILINGVAWLQFVPYKAVTLGPVYGFYPGTVPPFVIVEYGGSSRMAWDRKYPNESPNLARWLELGQNDLKVWEALELYGLQPKSTRERCRNLYVVFEIIRSDVRGEKHMAANGWASKNAIDACRIYLNAYRHPQPTSPMSGKMTLWKAEALMRSLLQHWLDDKLASRP